MLAAGLGRRLGALTESDTKCMVPFLGAPLIDRMLDALTDAGVSQFVFVVGHGAGGLKRHVKESWRGIPVEYIDNLEFETTNNIHSLELASATLMNHDCLIVESDLIIDPQLVLAMVKDERPNLAAVAPYEMWMDGTVVETNEQGSITQFVPKELIQTSEGHDYFKTVNIYKFSQSFSTNLYVPFLKAYCATMGRTGYYEEVLRVVSHLDSAHLQAFYVDGQRWFEIDDQHDLAIGELLFSSTEERFSRLSQRFGGLWRFNDLADYCYLVNPYFPPDRLIASLASSLEPLITHYPSGQEVQRMLAARMLGLEPHHVLVGNGATELIVALAESINGTSIYGQTPTFEEFPTRFGNNFRSVEHFDESKRPISELLDESRDTRALLLVNPDNPTGVYYTPSEVATLIEQTAARDQMLVIDESFVDFSEDGPDASLLSSKLLDRYPNLVVLKSISKSYGVPGIRLGVLATSRQDLIQDIKSRLPVWNVSSIAESFMQSVGSYDAQYREACALLARERERFTQELNSVHGLEALPSQANFVLCKIENMTSSQFCHEMLNQGFFVKDLAHKRGLAPDRFVRIAIRTTAENKRFSDSCRQVLGSPTSS